MSGQGIRDSCPDVARPYIPWATNGHNSDFNNARPSPVGGDGTTSRFMILRAGSSMVHAFESNWQVRAVFNAQFTQDALVSGEQFGIAGATAVRGFLEREIVRDTGITTNLELYSPSIAGKLISGEGDSLRGLLFFDIAGAANKPLEGETRRKTLLSSLGAGVRWNYERNFNMRFDLARVMNAEANNQAGDLRGHISVFYSF